VIRHNAVGSFCNPRYGPKMPAGFYGFAVANAQSQRCYACVRP